MFFVISVAWAGVLGRVAGAVCYWHLADVDGAADQCPFTEVRQTSRYNDGKTRSDP